MEMGTEISQLTMAEICIGQPFATIGKIGYLNYTILIDNQTNDNGTSS